MFGADGHPVRRAVVTSVLAGAFAVMPVMIGHAAVFESNPGLGPGVPMPVEPEVPPPMIGPEGPMGPGQPIDPLPPTAPCDPGEPTCYLSPMNPENPSNPDNPANPDNPDNLDNPENPADPNGFDADPLPPGGQPGPQGMPPSLSG